MYDAQNIVVWVNKRTREVVVCPLGVGCPHESRGWCDPIGAHYAQWGRMTDAQRVQLMLETAIDLAMQGFPLAKVLKAFAVVEEFRALGSKSYPMCRALTSALVGKCLEPNTMTFEELLEHYRPQAAE
jgi:hypothetical protein